MKFRFFPLAVLTIALVACSNPHDTVLPNDVNKWDDNLKAVVQKLPEEERALLAAYFLRTQMAQAFGQAAPATDLTIGAAIAEQKQWLAARNAKEAEAKALKEKIEAERAALKKSVDEMLTVAVVELRLEKANYEARIYRDMQVIQLALQNKGNKDIKGVKGIIQVIDIFDKTVGAIGFAYDAGIPAGETKTWTGSSEYNQFREEDRDIAHLEKGKYTTRFVPEVIVFADGSKLQVSE